MKFNAIRRSMSKFKPLLECYKDVLRQVGCIDEVFAPAFYLNWGERLGTTPTAVQQSLDHIGLFSADKNRDRDKYTMLLDSLWRMLANKDTLKQGAAVLPYRHFTIDEEVEVWFDRLENIPNTNRVKLHMRVLTGHYASGQLTVELTDYGVFRILAEIGYSGSSKYPTPIDPVEILGLYGKLSLGTSDTGTRIRNIISDNSIVEYNRKEIIRYRVGLLLCPYDVGRLCINCEETDHSCRASYHIGTFQYGIAPGEF